MNPQEINETVDSIIQVAEQHRRVFRKPHDEIMYAEVHPRFFEHIKNSGALDYLDISHNIIVKPKTGVA